MTGQQALESTYFTGQMFLLEFLDATTPWDGQRGNVRVLLGELGSDVLQWLRDDPYWSLDNGLSWDAPRGTKIKSDRKRMRSEHAVNGLSPFTGKPAKTGVKIQVAGHVGGVNRTTFNGLHVEEPLPAVRASQWMGALRKVNAGFFGIFYEALRHNLLAMKHAGENLGDNGAKILEFQAGVIKIAWKGHRLLRERFFFITQGLLEPSFHRAS